MADEAGLRAALAAAAAGSAVPPCTAVAHAAVAMLLATRCVVAADWGGAVAWMEHAASLDAACPLVQQCLVYVRGKAAAAVSAEQAPAAGVYADAEAFRVFSETGSNVALYASVAEALRGLYGSYEGRGRRLLDIGVGGGRALIPALAGGQHPFESATLVEPSLSLQDCLAGLAAGADGGSSLALEPFAGTIGAYMALRGERLATEQGVEEDAEPPWDLVQATFSLQSLSAVERLAVFRWLSERCQRLVLVEFDVPRCMGGAGVDAFDPERFLATAQAFRTGCAEYAGAPVVTQGFLCPVFFGKFGANATNFEQPADSWVRDLEASGFVDVRTRLLCQYWWAPCFLVEALPRRSCEGARHRDCRANEPQV